MYRRLKNLLGISLIILALLISQLPMPEVVADEVAETTTTEVTTAQATTSQSTISEDVTPEAATPDAGNEVAVIDDGDGNTDGDTAGTTETTVTVTFDYRLTGINNETQTITISNGVPQTLTRPSTYTVDLSYPVGDNGREMIFKGWFKDVNGYEAWDFDSMTVLDQDISLYAQWVRDDDAVAVITYSATDAELYSNVTVDVTFGSPIPRPVNTPVRPGYEVDYWVIDGETTEVNWDQAVAGDITLKAVWKAKEYTLTLDLNGASLGSTYSYNGTDYEAGATELVIKVPYDTSFDGYFPTDNIVYNGVTLDNKWYTDENALAEYNQAALIKKDTTLYKRVVDAATQASTGFMLNIDGSVLYHYDHPEGASDNVVIPTSVKTIGVNAFDDLNGIKSVTLPANIKDIREGAFSGAESLTNSVTVYASGTSDSMRLGKLLADRYDNIVYQESASTEVESAILQSLNCSLYESNAATGESSYSTYVDFLLPIGMESGNYTVAIAPNDVPLTIDDLLAAAGITDSARLYHMDINFQKDGRTYSNYRLGKTFTVILPLPQKWQSYDLAGKTVVYTVSMDGSSLETLAATILVKDGIKCVKFEPYHFSEYAVYFAGELVDVGGGNNKPGNNNSGNSNTGNSGAGNNNSGGSNTGNSNTGSSNSGNNNSGSNNSGNNGSNSGSSSNNSGSNSSTTPGTNTSSSSNTGAGTGTTPNSSSSNTGTGQGNGAAHVKDSTPKTGDPLEYRTMAVCIIFSLGVLILLIGNERKERVSRTSRFLRG